MKCPKCGGNAELSNWGSYTDPDFADFHVECEKCGYHSMGSTDPQKAKEMFENGMGMYYTNEQWIRHMNTEQLAELLTKVDEKFPCGTLLKCNQGCGLFKKCISDDTEPTNAEAWVEWLKQPHSEVKE